MNLPNAITAVRILCSAAILFCNPLSPMFFALYVTAGVSDIVDGWIARRTNTASEFGSKFDTAKRFRQSLADALRLLSVVAVHYSAQQKTFITVLD